MEEQEKIYYVYKWFLKDTGQIFYIGKGTGDRYKQTYGRNKIFQQYYKNKKNCDKAIIEEFVNEEQALQREHELILQYWNKGEAKANIDDGGHSGKHFPWTKEMREYLSKYNPMKNPEIVKKSVQNRKKRAIEYQGKIYSCASEVKEIAGVSLSRIDEWCKRGYDNQYIPCRYIDEEYKLYNKERMFLNPASKAVLIDGIYFNTLKEAAQFVGGNAAYLGRILNQGKTSYLNHTCSYANQQPSQENNQ